MVNPQHVASRRLHLHRQSHLREAPDFSSLQAELQGFGGRLTEGTTTGWASSPNEKMGGVQMS